MAAIDRDPCGSTMIRVSIEVRELLEEEKIIPREPLNDCIKRGILENRNYRNNLPIETKETLKKEIETVVINPEVKGVGKATEYYRDVWNENHPENLLTHGEEIHHIDGNHNNNAIENLMKVKREEHGELHTELRKTNPLSHSSKGQAIIGKNI